MLTEERYQDVRVFTLCRPILGRPFYHTAAFYLDGLMVDAGCVYTVDELLAALAGSPVDTVVNTHSHEDHVAADAALRRRYGCPVLAHAETVPVLLNPALRGRLQFYRKVLWGSPEPVDAEVIGDQVEMAHGRFDVWHTPGHSPDHIILFDTERGWAFTGDLFVGGQDRAARPDANVADIIGSLRRLVAVEPEVLFPGSGSVRVKPVEELHQKIAYLEELRERVRILNGQGWTISEICKRLFKHRLGIEFITFGDFSSDNLVRACLKEPS